MFSFILTSRFRIRGTFTTIYHTWISHDPIKHAVFAIKCKHCRVIEPTPNCSCRIRILWCLHKHILCKPRRSHHIHQAQWSSILSRQELLRVLTTLGIHHLSVFIQISVIAQDFFHIQRTFWCTKLWYHHALSWGILTCLRKLWKTSFLIQEYLLQLSVKVKLFVDSNSPTSVS